MAGGAAPQMGMLAGLLAKLKPPGMGGPVGWRRLRRSPAGRWPWQFLQPTMMPPMMPGAAGGMGGGGW
jgi:hypothetical protein